MNNNVEFQDLLGEHFLTGIDMGTMPRKEYDYESANTVDFIIDGEIYLERPFQYATASAVRCSLKSFSVPVIFAFLYSM